MSELLSWLPKIFSALSASVLWYVQSYSQGFRETFSALCIALLQASLYAMTCSSIHSKKAPARHLCFICQSSFLRALQGKASAIAPLYRQSSRCGTRNQQGFKASLSVVNTSSQGLSKASARLHYPYSNLLLKGPARFV